MDPLAAHAAAMPDKPAVIDDRPGEAVRSMTFAELNRCVNRIASGLRGRGVVAGAKVMWGGQNSLELVAFTHAARKIGAIAVPLNYRLTDEETTYVVTNSDTELVWLDAEFADRFERIRPAIPAVRDVVVFGGDARPGQVLADEFLGDDVEPAEPATAPGTMIYTSGTTGKPKGAVKTGSASLEQSRGLLELHRLPARRRLHHHRAALPLAVPAGSWASPTRWARRWCCSASSTPRTGCGC